MNELFDIVLDLTLSGSIVIAIVLLARRIMSRFPKKYSYILWLVAAFKLLCPWSPSAKFSFFNLIPLDKAGIARTTAAAHNATSATGNVTSNAVRQTAEMAGRQMMADSAERAARAASAARTINEAGAAARPASAISPVSSTAASSQIDVTTILMLIWIAGILILTSLVIFKTIMVCRKLRDSKNISENIYSSSVIVSPFVFGVLRPRIYMPQGLTDDEYEYLLLHEKTHIKRKDMLFKALGIAILIIHWFNPLVWLAYRLFEMDMEMSCDEAVIRNIDKKIRADYCMSLVTYAKKSTVPKYLVVPISFGRKDVKARIEHIMKYKKVTKTATAASLLTVALIATGCFFGPSENKPVTTENKGKTQNSQDLDMDNLAYKMEITDKDKTDETVVEPSETDKADETVVEPSETADKENSAPSETTVETTVETTAETTAAPEETAPSENSAELVVVEPSETAVETATETEPAITEVVENQGRLVPGVHKVFSSDQEYVDYAAYDYTFSEDGKNGVFSLGSFYTYSYDDIISLKIGDTLPPNGVTVEKIDYNEETDGFAIGEFYGFTSQGNGTYRLCDDLGFFPYIPIGEQTLEIADDVVIVDYLSVGATSEEIWNKNEEQPVYYYSGIKEFMDRLDDDETWYKPDLYIRVSNGKVTFIAINPVQHQPWTDAGYPTT